MRWPAGVDIFYKERLRVYPSAGLNGCAFDDKDGQALFLGLQSCTDVILSLSCDALCIPAGIWGQKKHAQVLLPVPRHGAGSEKIDSC